MVRPAGGGGGGSVTAKIILPKIYPRINFCCKKLSHRIDFCSTNLSHGINIGCQLLSHPGINCPNYFWLPISSYHANNCPRLI